MGAGRYLSGWNLGVCTWNPIHQGYPSTPDLSRATALPELVSSWRSFRFYGLELDRTELPRVLDTACLLPRPCPPRSWSLWGWWLTGFYITQARKTPGCSLHWRGEQVSRLSPGCPGQDRSLEWGVSGWTWCSGILLLLQQCPRLNTQSLPHFKKDGKFILTVWKCCLYEKRFSVELKWFASGHDLSLCLQRTS